MRRTLMLSIACLLSEAIHRIDDEVGVIQLVTYDDYGPDVSGTYSLEHNVWHDPAPKKIPFKQAQVRQSFRQSMRSVNRNR